MTTSFKVLGISSSPRIKGRHCLFDSLSAIMLQGVMEKIGEQKEFSTEIIELFRHTIHSCRGCFSDMETRCHYLCDCYDDDFRAIAEKIICADAVVFASPTYMFGMSSMLKRFFERWVSFKMPRIDKAQATKSFQECFDVFEKLCSGEISSKNPLAGKVAGIVAAGSELGQDNVVKEMMLILNLYGFILPPNCFIYHTGHSMQSLEEVRNCFYENKWLLSATRNLAESLTRMVRLTRNHSWPQMDTLITRD
jgi:multimeric flavodoxin WrbA